MELWSRYTSNKGTPGANKGIAFAHLINESSPRSVAAAGSVSGLRRWASCGVEFPASIRKKRRTHGVFQADKGQDEDVFAGAPSSDNTVLGQSIKPNVAEMVQRMRECVSKSQSRVSSQLPSSSSPLPDGGDHLVLSPGSPLERRTREQSVETSKTIPGHDETMIEHAHIAEEPIRRSFGSSDEFDDDDFDTDMAEALDEQPLPVVSEATIPTEPIHQLPQIQTAEAVIPMEADSDDEFGMEDEDGFAEGLENVVSLYDTRTAETPLDNQVSREAAGNDATIGNAAPAVVIDLESDDSDDFGEDIDVDAFAAAEVAATQTQTNPVCRTRTYP